MHKDVTRALGALLLVGSLPAGAFEQRLETELGLEARWYPEEPLSSRQDEFGVSLRLLPEWYGEWQRGAHSVSITPFARYDSMDSERSHVDVRELHWQGVFGALELRAGISRVFWGKTEVLHLVDVINQDDAIEDLDGEDKLGQPMLRASWALGSANLQAYVLPYFRERPFASLDGRLRAPLPVRQDDPLYESSREQKHVDYALRLEGYAGSLDYGFSAFTGTSRDPQLLPSDFVNTAVGPQPTALTPYYALMDQLGFDGQFTTGSWLFKLEALWRDTSRLAFNPDLSTRRETQRYSAATGGLEYAFYGIFDSPVDASLVLEYLWDERGRDSEAPFQNDLFIATRLAANDVRGSELLGGVVVDLDQGSLFGSVEASRRLSASLKLSLELRLFSDIDPRDQTLRPVRQDDYLQLELIRYF